MIYNPPRLNKNILWQGQKQDILSIYNPPRLNKNSADEKTGEAETLFTILQG